MKPARIATLVLGCLLVLPALALFVGGVSLGLAYAFGRDDDGYFDVSLERLESSTVAVTAEELDLNADPGTPDRLLDSLDVDVRLRATNADSARPLFIGIGSESDVDAYLAGSAHDEIDDVDNDLQARYRNRAGSLDISPPTEEDFWAVSATGSGTQEMVWEATSGRWAVVMMNADGSPGVAVDAEVGAKAGFVGPLIAILLGIGALLTAGAVALIAFGASGRRDDAASAMTPAPGTEPAVALGSSAPAEPVALTARLDPELSSWKWLVKWFLAIPHVIVLAFLAIAFVVLTVVAGFAILFTGRYPRGIFDFNVGVLRWGWRVSYYASSGGIGTDRYPPFSLADDPDYPARLAIDYPAKLSRGLVLVKWWLLAVPHYLIVALLVGGSFGWATADTGSVRIDPTGGAGLLGLLVLVAGVILLFTNRYPRRLFDLIIGLNRWIYRVVAYAALMTDRYPPFHLDQGGSEPAPPRRDDEPPDASPAEVDLRGHDEEVVAATSP